MSSSMAGPPRPTMEAAPEPPRNDEPDPEDLEHFDTPGEGARPQTIAIGQWVRYRVAWREGAQSTTEYRVVDREDDSWWIEMTDRRSGQTRHVRMRVRPGRAGRTHELLGLYFKTGNEEREVPSRLLSVQQQQMQTWIDILFPADWDGRPQEDVQVPAGIFHGAYKGEQNLSFNNTEVVADVWHHPQVPLTGMVKFRDQAEGGHTLQLVAYGTEGARSAF